MALDGCEKGFSHQHGQMNPGGLVVDEPKTYCPVCFYPVAQPSCPECGRSFTADDLEHSSTWLTRTLCRAEQLHAMSAIVVLMLPLPLLAILSPRRIPHNRMSVSRLHGVFVCSMANLYCLLSLFSIWQIPHPNTWVGNLLLMDFSYCMLAMPLFVIVIVRVARCRANPSLGMTNLRVATYLSIEAIRFQLAWLAFNSFPVITGRVVYWNGVGPPAWIAHLRPIVPLDPSGFASDLLNVLLFGLWPFPGLYLLYGIGAYVNRCSGRADSDVSRVA